MGGEIFADDMTVLFRDLRGESSLYIEAFSGRLGALSMMKRISAKKTSALPDIFDDIEASLNPSSSGDLKFVGGFEIRRRRPEIASAFRASLSPITAHSRTPPRSLGWCGATGGT